MEEKGTIDGYVGSLKRYAVIGLAAVQFALPLGCASVGQYGNVVPNIEVTQGFINFNIKKDHRYYVDNEVNPSALLAVDGKYQLDEISGWKEINAEPENIADIVRRINQRAAAARKIASGKDLVCNGIDLGDIYFPGIRTNVRLDGNKVSISASEVASEAGGDGGGGSGGSGSGGGGSGI